jgi:hypothetical protein
MPLKNQYSLEAEYKALEEAKELLLKAFKNNQRLTTFECDPVGGDEAFAINVPTDDEEDEEGINIYVELHIAL